MKPQNDRELRDFFAAHATEQDIQKYQWEVAKNTGYILIKHEVRTREEARYAYADAMLKARDE